MAGGSDLGNSTSSPGELTLPGAGRCSCPDAGASATFGGGEEASLTAVAVGAAAVDDLSEGEPTPELAVASPCGSALLESLAFATWLLSFAELSLLASFLLAAAALVAALARRLVASPGMLGRLPACAAPLPDRNCV